jgi:hypothetical protein
MAWKRGTIILGWLAVLGILFAGSGAIGRDTEEQLLQQIQSESNPVRKAKIEIKLGKLKLTQVQGAYTQGHIEEGAKLLDTFVGVMKTSWKLLQDSGRQASRQPDGFRELEIALREHARSLQDLQRTVSYFDRAPLVKATQELEQMRAEVLHSLFPGGGTRLHKQPAPPPSVTNPGN